MPPNDITAISVVPPPISTTRCPNASSIGSPAPIAAATGSSIIIAFLAPAASVASITALFSTVVASAGTLITTLIRL